MSIIAVTFDDVLIDIAEAKASEMKFKEHRSIVKDGKRIYIGMLGEFIVVDHFGGFIVIPFSYDYDAVINGRKVDVKTKSCNSEPQPYFLCDIPANQMKQACESYYFVRIDMDRRVAYLLGGLSKKAFFERARHYQPGEPVEDSPINFSYTFESYAVIIDQLKQPSASRHYSHAASQQH